MTVIAHVDALNGKHLALEASIQSEQSRPMPDFTAIAELKKRKLRIKEELNSLQAGLPRQRHG